MHATLGTAVAWDGHFNSQTKNAVFFTVMDLILNCVAFIYIGAWLPFDSYNTQEVGIHVASTFKVENSR